MKRERSNSHDGGAWRSLTARARQAPAEPVAALPAGFVERVLAAVPGRAALVRAAGPERVVAVAAGLALAASLLVAAWCWADVQAVLAAGPASLEQIVQLEPTP